MIMPRYPEIHVRLHSRNPLALVSAVRAAMRKQRIDDRELRRFTDEAMAQEEPDHMVDVCSSWAEIEVC
ncbi:MAG: hypothetical protein MPN21_10030 [Thermoanaerobaculia bacterium]|nr:hypothetical protein [Thermoanaerobaculia bacterium]